MRNPNVVTSITAVWTLFVCLLVSCSEPTSNETAPNANGTAVVNSNQNNEQL